MALTKQEVNGILKAKGFNKFKYARRIHKHRSTVTRIVSGEIGGRLRKRFAEFLGVSESELPTRSQNGS